MIHAFDLFDIIDQQNFRKLNQQEEIRRGREKNQTNRIKI
jgi:hypothetical protein